MGGLAPHYGTLTFLFVLTYSFLRCVRGVAFATLLADLFLVGPDIRAFLLLL
jgi:hypothetical protein